MPDELQDKLPIEPVVYIVTHGFEFDDGNEVVAVFQTEEGARQFKESRRPKRDRYQYAIEKHTLRK